MAGSSAFVTRPCMELFADFCRDEILHALPEDVRRPMQATVVGIQCPPAGSLPGSAGALRAQVRMLCRRALPPLIYSALESMVWTCSNAEIISGMLQGRMYRLNLGTLQRQGVPCAAH